MVPASTPRARTSACSGAGSVREDGTGGGEGERPPVPPSSASGAAALDTAVVGIGAARVFVRLLHATPVLGRQQATPSRLRIAWAGQGRGASRSSCPCVFCLRRWANTKE
jgi:hypothetical protein